MPRHFEKKERRKRRDPEIIVWDRWVRFSHWLLALAFATLYLEYRKFPLHTYAGYLVITLVILRVVWGFIGPGAANFSTFKFSFGEIWTYFRNALRGHADYHFSHNPLGAAMVYGLLATLLVNALLGLLAYSASQQLGPFGALVPDTWEDNLIQIHTIIGHLTAAMVAGHLIGVLWASRLHRENYVLAMLSGIRRIPRAMSIPSGAMRLVRKSVESTRLKKLLHWLNYTHPFLGAGILMALIFVMLFLPLINLLVSINKFIPAY